MEPYSNHTHAEATTTDRKRVFIHSEDEELAVKLVKLLDRHGVTGLWVDEEEGEELEQLWALDTWIKEVEGDCSLAEL